MRYPVGKDNNDFLKNWYVATEFGSPESYGFHEALDINLNTGGNSDLGQPLYAVADGKIVYYHNNSHPSKNFGRHMVLECDTPRGKRWYHYAHCQEITDHVQEVKEGDVIGKLGNSGTEAAHLHFAALKVDPSTLPGGIDSIAKTKDQLNQWWERFEILEDTQSSSLKYTEEEMTKVRLERDNNWNSFQEAKTLAEETKKKLKEEQDSRQKDLESIGNRLHCGADVPSIISNITTLITYEDKARELEQKLSDEHNEYEKRLKAALDKVESLQKQLDMVTTELEDLKANKPDTPTSPDKSFISKILEAIFGKK